MKRPSYVCCFNSCFHASSASSDMIQHRNLETNQNISWLKMCVKKERKCSCLRFKSDKEPTWRHLGTWEFRQQRFSNIKWQRKSTSRLFSLSAERRNFALRRQCNEQMTSEISAFQNKSKSKVVKCSNTIILLIKTLPQKSNKQDHVYLCHFNHLY